MAVFWALMFFVGVAIAIIGIGYSYERRGPGITVAIMGGLFAGLSLAMISVSAHNDRLADCANHGGSYVLNRVCYDNNDKPIETDRVYVK